MTLNLIDRSNYFKGLLLLIRKDNIITIEEREIVKRLGKILGFDKKFVRNAINEVLVNEYIIDEPPEFINKELAGIFIKDGVKLAFADKKFDSNEIGWLKSVAEKNGIDPGLIDKEIEKSSDSDYNIEIEKYLQLSNYPS